MERLSGNVQESESDTEETPVTSPHCYKEMYRQINDAFFLLITAFDTKIRHLPALRIAPKEEQCFHCSVPGFAGHPHLPYHSSHTSLKERCRKLGRQKAQD